MCVEKILEKMFCMYVLDVISVQIFKWRKLAMMQDEFFLLQELFKVFQFDF